MQQLPHARVEMPLVPFEAAPNMVELDFYHTASDAVTIEDKIDDATFAKGLHEQVKAENFAAGLPIFYQEDENDLDCVWYIFEYPNGDKKRVHEDDLDKM